MTAHPKLSEQLRARADFLQAFEYGSVGDGSTITVPGRFVPYEGAPITPEELRGVAKYLDALERIPTKGVPAAPVQSVHETREHLFSAIAKNPGAVSIDIEVVILDGGRMLVEKNRRVALPNVRAAQANFGGDTANTTAVVVDSAVSWMAARLKVECGLRLISEDHPIVGLRYVTDPDVAPRFRPIFAMRTEPGFLAADKEVGVRWGRNLRTINVSAAQFFNDETTEAVLAAIQNATNLADSALGLDAPAHA